MSAVVSIDPYAAHRAAEARAWADYMEAVARTDIPESMRLATIISDLHKARPAGMVRLMEQERGLL